MAENSRSIVRSEDSKLSDSDRVASKRKFEAQTNPDPKNPKKKRRRKNHSIEFADVDTDNGINLALSRMSTSLLADHIARKTKRFAPDLSPVELEDRRLAERTIFDTSNWPRPRLTVNLPEFLKTYSSTENLQEQVTTPSEQTGSPHTIVVTSAGLRAADLTRVLRVFQTKEAAVAKLFAKHIKLQEAIKYVGGTRMGVGVGTPSRLIDLLDSGALRLSRLRRLVLDSSHVDQKQRGVFDMRETLEPLLLLLKRPEIRDRYGNGTDDAHNVYSGRSVPASRCKAKAYLFDLLVRTNDQGHALGISIIAVSDMSMVVSRLLSC